MLEHLQLRAIAGRGGGEVNLAVGGREVRQHNLAMMGVITMMMITMMILMLMMMMMLSIRTSSSCSSLAAAPTPVVSKLAALPNTPSGCLTDIAHRL